MSFAEIKARAEDVPPRTWEDEYTHYVAQVEADRDWLIARVEALRDALDARLCHEKCIPECIILQTHGRCEEKELIAALVELEAQG